MTLNAAQQELAASYESLARGQAWHFYKRSTGADIDDVLSAAMLGLVSGIDAYPAYCARNGYTVEDGLSKGFLKAYLLRRINGAILDLARSNDHMTRSARNKVKALRRAEDDGIRDEAGQARATGLTVAEAQRVKAAALVTVSLDDQDVLAGAEYAGAAVTDLGADVESRVAVRQTLAVVVTAFDLLPPVQRVLVAFVFHQGLDITVAAQAVYLSEPEARQLLETAVCAIHRALLRQVTP